MEPLTFGDDAMKNMYLAGLTLIASMSVACAVQPDRSDVESDTTSSLNEGLSDTESSLGWGWNLPPFKATGETLTVLAPVGDVPVYTSRGAGAWGPPVRVLAPPEVPIITLRRR